MVVKNETLMSAGGVLAVVAALIGAGISGEVFTTSPASRDSATSQQTLSKMADQLNRTLPLMVDKDTELASTLGMEGRFVYNYRLVNHDSSDFDSSQLIEVMRPRLVNGACTPQTIKILKHGVTMRYTYADRSNRFIASIDVRRTDCAF